MAFTKADTQTPTDIRRIKVVLVTAPPAEGETMFKSYWYEVEITDQNGNIMHARGENGDLTAHISAAIETQLDDFMAFLRTKAETELLEIVP